MGNIFSNTDEKEKKEEESAINRTLSFFGDYLYKSFVFIFIFCLCVINLIAVSISLQCNTNESVFFKITSAIFASMFGIFYIIVNYYLYRVGINNNPCIICNTNIFKL